MGESVQIKQETAQIFDRNFSQIQTDYDTKEFN